MNAALASTMASRRVLLAFAALNLLGLFPDVWLAHTSFWHERAELVPLVVSAVAGVVVLALAFAPLERAGVRLVLDAIAVGCIGTGAAGLALHLGAGAPQGATLERLVYSAPILAPAAYAGLGLLILAGVHVTDDVRRGRAIELLCGLGLLANFVLCLLDHAQNGFWAKIEWVSVVAGALGGLTFLARAAFAEDREGERGFAWLVLVLMLLVGVAGGALHLSADLHAEGPSLLDRLRYGAPVFAPLLFCDLAALGALGLLTRRARA